MATASFFYFAWVGSTETSWNGSHMREDELIFAFELKHEEGQVAELELEIVNPHIGLLSPGRPLWAWFAWNDGSTVHPLFFGRLVGIPDDLTEDVITIKFVARPKNYTEQQLALAETLKVLPFYDPIFIDDKKLGDPDTVLEGRSALWHVDRVTHAVTISDIIAGEDGVEEFAAQDVFYDGVKIKLAGAPLIVCEIEAEVGWVQTSNTGVIRFETKPDLGGSTDIGDGFKVTGGFAGQDSVLGLGQYNVELKKDDDKDEESYTLTTYWMNTGSGPFANGETLEWRSSETRPWHGGDLIKKDEKEIPGDPETGQGYEYSITEHYRLSKENPIPPGGGGGAAPTPDPVPVVKKNEMKIAVEVEQDRTERMHVRVLADVQPVLTEATEQDGIKETLSMSARDVVAAGAATSANGSYFPTDRGLQSLEHLLMVARAHLLAGSRVFEVSWECPFQRVIGLSCRKNATIEDSRLPGGIALGKIVAYEMTGDGDDGEFLGNVTINSAVGNGNAVTLADGTPVYVAVGYVDPGYQHYSGKIAATLTNDMAFEPLAYQTTGIQLPISLDQVLIRHEYMDTGRDAAINAAVSAGISALRALDFGQSQSSFEYYVPGQSGPPSSLVSTSNVTRQVNAAIRQALVDHPVWVEIELAPVQNISTDVEFDAEIAPLVVPKQVDLAAGSTP